MTEKVLQKWVVKEISKRPDLFGKVANYMGHTPRYFLNVLRENPAKLTQAGVLEILRKDLGSKDSELLTEREKAA